MKPYGAKRRWRRDSSRFFNRATDEHGHVWKQVRGWGLFAMVGSHCMMSKRPEKTEAAARQRVERWLNSRTPSRERVTRGRK